MLFKRKLDTLFCLRQKDFGSYDVYSTRHVLSNDKFLIPRLLVQPFFSLFVVFLLNERFLFV